MPAASSGLRLGQGQLPQLALDHLRAHPDQEWTATGIAKEIGRSSGAIANALATMTGRGEAEMTCAAPAAIAPRSRPRPHPSRPPGAGHRPNCAPVCTGAQLFGDRSLTYPRLSARVHARRA